MSNEWIDVEDRLPEHLEAGHEFLVWSKDWGMEISSYSVRGSYSGFDWNGGCAIERMTTHWQPLPAPPTEEANAPKV